MFKRIYRADFICSKYVLNLFITLFIVECAASFIKSDISGRFGNTTASLRLTRQKVLIQAVPNIENFGSTKKTREKKEIDNRDEYSPPDIVVEEFRIRAKINFQARPRTCKDLLRDFYNSSKNGIGFSRSQNRRILYCQTEPVMKKNQSIVDIKKSSQRSSSSNENLGIFEKIFSPKTTKDYSNIKISFDSKNHDSLKKKTLWKKVKNRKIKKDFFNYLLETPKPSSDIIKDKIVQEIKDQKMDKNSWYEKFKISDNESTAEAKMSNTKSSPIFEDYEISENLNNELISDLRKKNDKRSIKNHDNVQPCHRKITKNVTDYLTALRTENDKSSVNISAVFNFSNENGLFVKNDNFSFNEKPTEKSDKIVQENDNIRSHIRIKRSINATNNFTTATSNNNHKKVSKKSNSNKKKKIKSETTTKKSHSDNGKSSPKKTQKSTKKKTKLAKRSNNTMANFTMPSTPSPLSSIIFSMFQPLIASFKELSKTQNLKSLAVDHLKKNNASYYGEKKYTTNATTINAENNGKDIISNLTVNDFSNLSEIPYLNVTNDRFSILPEIRYSNVTKDYFSTSPDNTFFNTTEIDRTILKTFLYPFKDSLSTSIVNASTDSSKISHETITDVRNVDEKVRADLAVNWMKKNGGKTMNSNVINLPATDFPSKDFTNNTFAVSQSTRSKDNEGKLSVIEMSAMNITANIGKNSTNISTEATIDKPEDYREKTTLNFTIIDTNCTETVLVNSQPNNSVNQSGNIAEVMSQVSSYPKLRRYSRNDTVDKTVSEKPKVTDSRYNEAKNRYTKNSLNDSTIPNTSRKGFPNRGRKRSRYKGKMQQPFAVGSQSRAVKQSWRNRNVPAITISSITSTSVSTLPTEIIDSYDSTGNGTSAVTPSFDDFPELSTVTNWRQIQISENTSILNDTANTFFYNNETSVPGSTEDFNEITQNITTPASNEFAEKREQVTSTWPPVTRVNSNFEYSSPSKEISTGLNDIVNDILTKKLTEFSTVSYDKSINPETLVTKKEDNSIVLIDPFDVDFGKIEKMKKKTEDIEKIEKSKKSDDVQILEEIKKNEIIESSSVTNNELIDYNTFITNELAKKNDKKISINLTPEARLTDTLNRKIQKIDLTKSTTKHDNRIKNDERKNIVANFTTSTIIDTLSNSVTSKDIIEKMSSTKSENTTNLDFATISSTIKPETKTEVISTKAETAIDVPTIEVKMKTIEKTTLATNSLLRSSRRARDTRNLPEYEEPQEPELDYDIDSLGEPEIFTEATRNMSEDNEEATSEASTAKDFPFTVALPHSAVHGVFFNEDKANEDTESTGIPGIQQIRDVPSQSLSTIRSSNSVKITKEYPDNLTNFIDEPEIVAFVKSLEDFLFDDSATGTFDRKQSLQDLDAESSNRNFETRSAIFKTKKLSVVNKKIGKNGNNWGKLKKGQSVKSANKKTSAKRNKLTTVKTKVKKAKIEKKKIKKKKTKDSLKARIAKTTKTGL